MESLLELRSLFVKILLKVKFLSGLSFLAVFMSACDFLSAPMSTIGTVTELGRDINYVYAITTVVVSLVGIVVAALMVIVIVKFKDKPGDDRIPEQVHGNFKLELLWSIIPVILLMFILIPTWEVMFKHEAPKTASANEFVVKVVGHQWWWEFEYPSIGITTANEVHLPENTAVRFEVSSADVLHSFWVPKFGGKIDAIPGEGMTNILALTTPAAIEKGGDYYQGQCVELCGLSHALMRFQAIVHKSDEWQRWVASHNTPPTIETTKEQRGHDLLAAKGCIGCHEIHGTAAVGKLGPSLTNFGNRKMLAAGVFYNTKDDLAKWLRNPPEIKPGALMQNLNLTEQEISDLSAFLRNSTYKNF